jgi:hypothetical protein
VCVIWLKSVGRFSRYAPETTRQVITLCWPSLPFKKVVHPTRHIYGMWGSCMCKMVNIGKALFEICSGNDLTSYNLLRPSFDLCCPSRRSCIPKGTSRACGDHVCVNGYNWSSTIRDMLQKRYDKLNHSSTFVLPSLPFKKVVHPKRHIYVMWWSCMCNMVEIGSSAFRDMLRKRHDKLQPSSSTFFWPSEGRTPQKAHLGHVWIMCV